jgi:hypothetical protein
MEMMLSRVSLSDVGIQLKELHSATQSNEAAVKDKIQKILMTEGGAGEAGASSNPEVEEARKKKLDEQVDTKI